MNQFRICFIDPLRDGEITKGGWCDMDKYSIDQAEHFYQSANEYFPCGWYYEFR